MRMCWNVVSTRTDSSSSSSNGLSIGNRETILEAFRYRKNIICDRLSPILKARTVSTLQGLLISCNQMSAEYLFMTDKLYDVRYDTGDKVIQCGRHNDIFKLWLQWRAKVQNPLYCYRKLPLCFLVTHRLCILSSDIIRSIVLRRFIHFYWDKFIILLSGLRRLWETHGPTDGADRVHG